MKRKIAAIIAADVVGYSRLVAEDEEETLRRLASYRAVFNDFITRFGGRIFNTAGDAILAEFQSAVDAVRCAIDLQESLRARNLAYPPSRHMSFRIGVTIGDVVERNGDLLGDGVNVAARLESMAPPGGICISRSVYESVCNKLSVKFSDKGRQHLKNIPDPVHVYTVMQEAKTGTNGPLRPAMALLKLRPHWGAVAAAIIIVAGIAGFTMRGIQNWGGSEEKVPSIRASESVEDASESEGAQTANKKTATAEPEDRQTQESDDRPPAADATGTVVKTSPSADRVAQDAVLQRQWTECHEGKDPKPTIEACTALIDYRNSTGPELALIKLKLGRAQREDNAVDEAIRTYSESIRLAPTAEAYNDRGIAHFDKGEWDDAISDYSEAIRIDKNFGEAYNNRAWTQLRAGRASLALDDANTAVRLLPEKAYAWDTRGQVNAKLGKRAEAIRDLRKALEFDPKSEGSKQVLRQLGEVP